MERNRSEDGSPANISSCSEKVVSESTHKRGREASGEAPQ